jgi:putative transposase
MNRDAAPPTYAGYRFPVELIGHAVWLYFRFALRYRDVEEVRAERGVLLTDATIRRRSRKFGQASANGLRRRRPRPGDTWHRDAVFIGSSGVQHSLRRAVDQEGSVLAILVQSRRDAAAARQCFRRLLKGLRYVPRVLLTDKRASYSAAKRAVLPRVEHRRHKGRNNRAENAHQPTRERERRMRRFTSPGHAQRCLAAYGPLAGLFRPRRHRLTAAAYRATRAARCASWRPVTGTPAMA